MKGFNPKAKLCLLYLFCEAIHSTNSFVPVGLISQRHHATIPRYVTSNLSQDEEKDTIKLLEGKLRVLETVIHEIKGREKENTQTANVLQKQKQTIQSLENELQESKARERKQNEAHESIQSKTSLHIEKIEELCNKKDQELQKYQSEIRTQNDEIEERSEKIRTLILQLTDSRDQMEELKQQMTNMRIEVEKEKRIDLLEMESEMEKRVQAYEKTIDSLQKKVETFSKEHKEYDERTEIATAAVNAADQRAEMATTKYMKAEQMLKQAQFHIKVQQLTLQSLEDEKLEIENENRDLQYALMIAEEEAARAHSTPNSKKAFTRLRSWLSSTK